MQVDEGQPRFASGQGVGVGQDVAKVEVSVVYTGVVHGPGKIGHGEDQAAPQPRRWRLPGPAFRKGFQAHMVHQGVADDERLPARWIDGAPAKGGHSRRRDARGGEPPASVEFVARPKDGQLEGGEVLQDLPPARAAVEFGEEGGAGGVEAHRAPIRRHPIRLALYGKRGVESVAAAPGER